MRIAAHAPRLLRRRPTEGGAGRPLWWGGFRPAFLACACAVLVILLAGPGGACIVMRDMRFSPEQLEEIDRYTARKLAEARGRQGEASMLYVVAAERRISALIHLRRPDEAAVLATETLKIHAKNPERNRGHLLRIRDHLAEALFRLGRVEEGIEVLREIVGQMRWAESLNFRCIRKLYHRLERLGRYEKAETLRRKELKVIQSVAGEDFWSNPRLKKSHLRLVEPRLLSELASLVEKQGRLDEARDLHSEALATSRLGFGDRPQTWRIARAYADFLARHSTGADDTALLKRLKTTYPRAFPP